jgi:segregation and condensation protein B
MHKERPAPMARTDPRNETGFTAAPADGGLSIDRLAQAFAAMMGQGDSSAPPPTPATVVQVDTSPDLDQQSLRDDDNGRVTPRSILEALLFVGLPGGEPLSSQVAAGLMRGVQPQEVDELAAELARVYREENRPYEVASRGEGWVMRLRAAYAGFGAVLEQRSRLVRLDAESLDALAVVAWHQPVPRDKLVEHGCDARPATLRTLVRRGLLAIEKSEEPDAAPAYVTTQKFLDVFKLESIGDLPSPHDPPK